MNAGKSLMTLCWEVFMKDVCRELGFVSPNVQAYTKKSSDHQKMWVILEICYIAFSDYMFFQFIKYCGNGNIVPTNENYCRFNSMLRSCDFIFVQQVALTYLHTLMLLWAWVHNNQPQDIYTAKNKLSLVFCGHNHWHYYFIISQEKMINFLIPRQIKDLKDSSLVLIRMKRTGHFQSGDAIIQEINKEAKRDIVRVSSDLQWKQSFRNLDKMNKMYENMFKDMCVKDYKNQHQTKSKRDIQREVFKIRILIHQSRYLSSLFEANCHTDLFGATELSSD